MVGWTARDKWLEVAMQTGHPCATPGVGGAALGTTRFDFSPLEFYLAAAFCSHMHPVAPSAASPEAKMIRALVAHHVEDAKSDFAIEATADGFKDYVKAYFSGTVATALAFIAMQRNGYSWSGHFEHLRPSTAKGRSPDFVFASTTSGTCLVESKGTRSNNAKTFDGIVEDGYLQQVERHLGKAMLNGAFASHGYCVGSWMTSVSKAELIVHHSEPPPPGPNYPLPGGTRPPVDDQVGRALEAVQQQDIGTAFALTFGVRYGEAVRGGGIDDLPNLARVRWIDREWIISFDGLDRFRTAISEQNNGSGVQLIGFYLREHAFAIEQDALRAALGRYWADGDRAAYGGRLMAFDGDVLRMARENGGAMLGDGLAVVPPVALLPVVRVEWDPWRGDFREV